MELGQIELQRLHKKHLLQLAVVALFSGDVVPRKEVVLRVLHVGQNCLFVLQPALVGRHRLKLLLDRKSLCHQLLVSRATLLLTAKSHRPNRLVGELSLKNAAETPSIDGPRAGLGKGLGQFDVTEHRRTHRRRSLALLLLEEGELQPLDQHLPI